MDKHIIEKHDQDCQKTKARLQENGVTGPWDNEPNRLNWKHAGLACMLVRNEDMLNWCGYVGVPPGHKFHGKDYGDVDVSVHGGLTYADACSGRICHVPELGEPDELWWLGFDCAHCRDLLPGHLDLHKLVPGYPERSAIRDEFDRYRGLAYVKAETELLAEQLAGVTGETVVTQY